MMSGQWCAKDGDWRATRALIEEKHGYAQIRRPRARGFQLRRSSHVAHSWPGRFPDVTHDRQHIRLGTRTATPGNVGCLLGIKDGLSIFNGQPDWRGPVADRMYMPTADAGRAITDAVSEAFHIAAIGRALAGEEPAPLPRQGRGSTSSCPAQCRGFPGKSPAEALFTWRTFPGTAGKDTEASPSGLTARAQQARFGS